jgi:L-amino acid N-acyltransferase YncA
LLRQSAKSSCLAETPGFFTDPTFNMEAPAIREARPADLPAIDSIYDHYVRTSTCTFQLEPAGLAARERWFASHGGLWPVLVAERGSKIVAWGSLSVYNAREGYRRTVEDSVYVDEAMQGQGIGKALLGELIDRGRALGHHTILAVIAGEQVPSVRLHERFGFSEVARMRELGWKYDRWLDVVFMQKML